MTLFRKAIAALLMGSSCAIPAGSAQAADGPSAIGSSTLTKEQCATAWALPAGETPKGGVLIMATFTMRLYSYPIFQSAVADEIQLMADNGIKFIRSYRVLYGEMDKYVDVWWACDYDTFTKAFYDLTYPKPNPDAPPLEGAGLLKDAVVEIVEQVEF